MIRREEVDDSQLGRSRESCSEGLREGEAVFEPGIEDSTSDYDGTKRISRPREGWSASKRRWIPIQHVVHPTELAFR